MKKILVTLAVLAMVAGLAMPAYAQTAVAGRTLADLQADNEAFADWFYRHFDPSDYPDSNDRHGTLVRFYDFSLDGGDSNTVYSLEKGTDRTYVPNNTIILGGFVDVITPILPSGTTNALGVNSAGDLVAAGTSFTNAGLWRIIPDGIGTNAVKATNNLPVNLTFTGTTSPTQGFFYVYLDVYYGMKDASE